MLLTMKKAANYLAKYQPTTRIFFDAQIRSFKLITQETTQFSTDYLYLGKVSALPIAHIFTERINFVLLEDTELPAGFRENHLVNFILIKNNYSLYEIINDVQEFFSIREFVSDSITQLLEALSQGKSIQDILNISYEILGNPLMLTDATHYLIGHAGWDENLDEPEWVHYLKHGYISNEFALAITNDLEFRQKMASDIVEPVVVHYDILKHPSMINRVYAKGANIAYLSILSVYRPFADVDFELARIICDIISIIMQQSQEKLVVANTEIESFIINILKNEYDDKYIEEKMSNYHLNTLDELCLICLDAGEVFDSAEKMFFVKSLMQNFFVGGISVIFNGKVLVLTECKHKGQLLLTKEKLSSLATLLRSHSLYAGISRPFTSLTELSIHYDQALNALKTAQHLNHNGPIFLYENYYFYYLVDSMLEHDNIKNICHPQLLELIKRDKEKSSSYALSLYQYLQHNGDIQQTAKVMHLHYNTMKYRLQRISEIAGFNLNDYNTLFKCKLTFIALELYHKIDFLDYFERVNIPEETPYLD
ncbi:MAG: hypothetical protein GX197_01385 [Firmicutes bacterium]|nr:hypothetical protein [Bacillota bacterium]